MRRGEIRWVALDAGGERGAKAQRPAVIVSNDGANAAAARRGKGVVTVVPIAATGGAGLPFQVTLPAGVAGLTRDATVLADQVRTVTAARVGPSIGALPLDHLRRIDDALRLHLAL